MKIRLFYRSLLRQKMAWTLNLLCLSVAFTVLFVVVKQVKYDFSYDTCYSEHENIYQLRYYNLPSGKYGQTLCIPLVHSALRKVPEVMAYTTLFENRIPRATFYCNEVEYREVTLYRVFPGFVNVFQPQILLGDAEEALKTEEGVIIPQSIAKKWFGGKDPLGQRVDYNTKGNLKTVKAVYKDFPENSSLHGAVFMRLQEGPTELSWRNWSYPAFFRAYPGISKEELQRKIVQCMDSVYLSIEEETVSSSEVLHIVPVKDLYFSPEGVGKQGNKALTYGLLAIGILIVIVAYINFINFSTALAPTRIEALNIYKVSGASGAELRRDIIGEAAFLSLFAWGLSIFWLEAFSGTAVAKAYFNASLAPTENLPLFLLLGVGALVLGALTGVYPAYYMTSFQPAMVLKGSFAMSGSGRRLRNSLLLFQFVVAIVLVIASLFIVLQYQYIRDLPCGYQRENVVYAYAHKLGQEPLEIFRAEAMRNPHVLDVTNSRFLPGNVGMSLSGHADTTDTELYLWPVAANFLSFFGIPVYQGDTMREPPEGIDYFILNRRMVEKFNMKDIVGKRMDVFGEGVVLGLAENVNFASMHEEIEPMGFICGEKDSWTNDYTFVKIRPENVPETIRYLQECFERYEGKKVEIKFLDDYIDELYRQEENLSHLISLFCLITVIIALAGIYGLILFNIRYKVKEIGIRKVHGSTSEQILWRLNGIFIRLVIGGAVVAIPLAYVLVNGWLSDYPYRTPIYWWVFVAACLITLLVTLATVSWQSWKAANSNPVDAVKGE